MVFVDDTDVGLELVKAGLAWVYEHYLPEASLQIQQSYTTAESAARTLRIGLWSDSNPVPPQSHLLPRSLPALAQRALGDLRTPARDLSLFARN